MKCLSCGEGHFVLDCPTHPHPVVPIPPCTPELADTVLNRDGAVRRTRAAQKKRVSKKRACRGLPAHLMDRVIRDSRS